MGWLRPAIHHSQGVGTARLCGDARIDKAGRVGETAATYIPASSLSSRCSCCVLGAVIPAIPATRHTPSVWGMCAERRRALQTRPPRVFLHVRAGHAHCARVCGRYGLRGQGRERSHQRRRSRGVPRAEGGRGHRRQEGVLRRRSLTGGEAAGLQLSLLGSGGGRGRFDTLTLR